jgi:hypothetical protein
MGHALQTFLRAEMHDATVQLCGFGCIHAAKRLELLETLCSLPWPPQLLVDLGQSAENSVEARVESTCSAAVC